jgi:hypothetical protein
VSDIDARRLEDRGGSLRRFNLFVLTVFAAAALGLAMTGSLDVMA